MGAAKIFESFIEAACGLRQLAGAKKTARGKVGVPQALGEFAQRHMPREVFRIEQRHAFVAGQRLDIALLLKEEFGGGGELLDGFGTHGSASAAALP